MNIFFGGAEHPGHRKRLLGWGVKALSINFKHLVPRLPKTKKFLVAERFPDDVAVITQCDSADLEVAKLYRSWCEDNNDRLTFAVAPDAEIEMADVWIPIWRPSTGHRTLQRLADKYTGIAVAQSAWEDERPVTARLNRLVTSQQTHVHGLGVAKLDLLAEVAFSSISNAAWISASRYGETQVWDGSQMHRFPAGDKEARQRWRAHIARLGVIDVDAVEADDRDAVSQLAVVSWMQLEAYYSRRRDVPADAPIGRVVSDTTSKTADGDIEDPDENLPVTTSSKRGTLVTTRERMLLPIMTVEEQATPDGEGRQDVLRLSGGTVRSCDSCALSDICPAMQEGASCAFDIPIRVRTKDELMGLVSGLVEMQSQRVFLGRFREDLEGSTDAVVSGEIDRLMRMTSQFKEMSEGADTLRIAIEAHGNAGVMSRLFGAQVGEAQRALPGGGLDERETQRVANEVLDLPVDAEVVSETTV